MRINKEAIPTIIICAVVILIAIPIAMYITSILEGKKYYTATFLDLDGVYQVQEKIEKNAVIYDPGSPYKDGYEFLGWYNDENIYDFNTPVTQDLYLKAKWLNTETNGIVQIDEKKEEEIKKQSTSNKNNGSSNNNGSNNNSSNNNGNSSNNNNGNNQTNPTPATPTPTPVPTPKVVPPSKPATKKYTITVNGGQGSGTYDEGSKVIITAITPQSKLSGWIGNTADVTGNYKYQEQTVYTFTKWSDGNTNISREIEVKENATYTAEFRESVTKVNAQTCTGRSQVVSGYPTSVSFKFSNTSGSGSKAIGSLTRSSSCVCTEKNEMNCLSTGEVCNVNPSSVFYQLNFKIKNTGTEWKVTYDRTTGKVILSGGKKVENSRTVKLEVTYRESEISDPNCDFPDPSQPHILNYEPNKNYNCSIKVASKSNSYTGTKKIEELVVQLPQASLSKTDWCEWVPTQ